MRTFVTLAGILLAAMGASQDYALRPGDGLRVRYVLGAESIVAVGPTEMQLEVPPGGVLTLPYAGSVSADGLTVRDLEMKITQLLRRRFPTAECFVLLEKLRPQFFSVIGEVESGGQFPLPNRLTVREAVALAGELGDRPERLQARLFRDGKLLRSFDLFSVATSEDPAASVLIQPGDVISVQTRRQIRVWVTGYVARPGAISVEEGTTVAELVAGGASPVTPTRRENATISVSRAGESVFAASVYAVDDGQSKPFTLQDGDFVSVLTPETAPVWVLGAVVRPGQVDVEVGSSLLQAIAAAGGGTETSSMRDIALIRDGATTTLNLRSETVSPKIRAGDMIYVSENVRRIAVYGEVNAPGLFVLRDDSETKLSDALGMAGGLTRRGPANRISIIRVESNGKVVRLEVDFSQYLKKGDAAFNPALSHGDVILCGETPRIDFQQVLSTIVSAVGIMNLVRR